MQHWMPMTRTYLLSASLWACQAERVIEDKTTNTPLAADAACLSEGCPDPSKTADAQPKSSLKSCAEQNIPSWEAVVAELVDFRCVRCHNETFAWKGVLLTNYQTFQLNQKGVKFRTEANAFTEPLDPLERKVILEFIKNGLPEKETDCVQAAGI